MGSDVGKAMLMFDEKTKKELLDQLGANAAAAAAAASSAAAIAGLLSSASKPSARIKVNVDPRTPMTFTLPEQRLGEKQMLQLRVVKDSKGFRVVDPRIAGNAASAPEFGVHQDAAGMNLAVVREGDLLHVYGVNAFTGDTQDLMKCIAAEQA
ncbi:MAG: hypothetical protein IPM54_10500 [Polyangiaceae bacterium]|nr:hypothetical protein [Polyangiaceae bacterium]